MINFEDCYHHNQQTKSTWRPLLGANEKIGLRCANKFLAGTI